MRGGALECGVEPPHSKESRRVISVVLAQRQLALFALLFLGLPPTAARADDADPLPPGAVVRLGTGRFRHGDRVNALAFSPDGKRLASGSHDRTVRLWDANTGALVRTLGGQSNFVPALAFSPDGKLLAAEMGDAAVHISEVETGRIVRKVPTRFADLLAFSPDGRSLATVERDGPARLHVRDAATGAERFPLPDPAACFAFSPDGQLLATGGGESLIVLRAASTGKELRRLEGLDGPAHVLTFAPGGKWLASAGGPFDRGIRLWDVAAGKVVRHFRDTGLPLFTADGTHLALMADGRLLLWDVARDREARRLPEGSGYRVAAFSPDGARVATAGAEPVIRLWDVASGRELFPSPGHAAGVSAVAFAPDGRTVATAGGDGTIRLWDAAGGRETKVLADVGDARATLAFSGDGRTLAAAARGGSPRLWDIVTLKEALGRPCPAPRDPRRALSPDGKVVAAASGPRVKLWEESTGRELLWIPGDVYGVNAVDFSPDGRFLATAGGGCGGAARVWEVATGQEVLTFNGHRGSVRAVAFAPDGSRLVSGGDDTTALVWSLAPPVATPAGAKELERQWAHLGGDDAAAAYWAVWSLAAAGDRAAEFVRPLVRQAANQTERIRRLLVDLDDDSFETRDAADRELRGLGAAAESALRRALGANPSAEVKRRAKTLLERLKSDAGPPQAGVVGGERLRTLRALHALERIGTKAARAALETVAGGGADERETREAKAALERLKARRTVP